MKKLIFVLLALSGTANADPFSLVIGASLNLLPVSVGYLAGMRDTNVPACFSEPQHKVAWKNNPTGYNFYTGGCDYIAKKEQLVEVK